MNTPNRWHKVPPTPRRYIAINLDLRRLHNRRGQYIQQSDFEDRSAPFQKSPIGIGNSVWSIKQIRTSEKRSRAGGVMCVVQAVACNIMFCRLLLTAILLPFPRRGTKSLSRSFCCTDRKQAVSALLRICEATAPIGRYSAITRFKLSTKISNIQTRRYPLARGLLFRTFSFAARSLLLGPTVSTLGGRRLPVLSSIDDDILIAHASQYAAHARGRA